MDLAATDSRRLAHTQTQREDCNQHVPYTEAHVLPKRICAALIHILPDTADQVLLEMTDKDFRFQVGDVLLYSRRLEGRFPRYKDVIPTRNDIRVQLDRAEFADLLARIIQFTSEESRGVDFTFGDVLTVTARDVGTRRKVSLSMLAATSVFGSATEFLADFVVRLDPGFVLEFLKTLPKTMRLVHMHLSDPEHPVVLLPSDLQGTYVVMPLSVERPQPAPESEVAEESTADASEAESEELEAVEVY